MKRVSERWPARPQWFFETFKSQGAQSRRNCNGRHHYIAENREVPATTTCRRFWHRPASACNLSVKQTMALGVSHRRCVSTRRGTGEITLYVAYPYAGCGKSQIARLNSAMAWTGLHGDSERATLYDCAPSSQAS